MPAISDYSNFKEKRSPFDINISLIRNDFTNREIMILNVVHCSEGDETYDSKELNFFREGDKISLLQMTDK